ncbi:Leucine-rich repeat receptor-like protein kinase [Zostera marina]|uniref:Leucine-rich repeat receptor-like protein kinase n=1 Tax=Zostera marina TaxID=29655 RepID=A0A0K9P1I9_ZOSMR|nr:Leucine-rich repeat receptor-like protein kinase [Zostera marina]
MKFCLKPVVSTLTPAEVRMVDLRIALFVIVLIAGEPQVCRAVRFSTQQHVPVTFPAIGKEMPLPLSTIDVVVLRDIKSSLHDLTGDAGSDFFSSWDFNSTSDPCTSFAGVSCSTGNGNATDRRVTSLALGTSFFDSPGLSGTLPPSFTNLTALTQFILFAGRVSGVIPNDIGEALPCLHFLSIANNLISGPIPASISELRDLHTLDLSHNRLVGQIPPSLCSSPNLKVLILASNGYLSGEVPDMVSPLLHLDLRGNCFTGKLPSLPATLRYFSASSNYMTGTLENVSGLPNLAFLDLAMNAFTGPIPASLFSPSISLLLLHRNYLSGGLPTAAPAPSDDDNFGGWTVDLSHNMLSGEISTVLMSAESVYLNNNNFVGVVPSEYSRSVFAGTMKTFYAYNNFLTGFDFPLKPGSATLLPSSVSVCLSYNCMDPSPVGPTVCPSSAGEVISRPTSQCSVVIYNGTPLT